MPLKGAAWPSYDGVPLDPLAGDDDALHLVGALADAGERRVAVEALDVVLLGIAVGAVDAHGFDAVLQRRLRREVLGHAGLEIAALAAVEGGRRVEREPPRGAGARGHLGKLELD